RTPIPRRPGACGSPPEWASRKSKTSSAISSAARVSFGLRSIISVCATSRIADSYTRRSSVSFGLPSISNIEPRLFPLHLRLCPEPRVLFRTRQIRFPFGDQPGRHFPRKLTCHPRPSAVLRGRSDHHRERPFDLPLDLANPLVVRA